MNHSSSAPVTTLEAGRDLVTRDLASLLDAATRLRKEAFGDKVSLCAIINAKSGNCGMDCRFCSQSGHHGARVETFPLLERDVLRERIARLRDAPIRHCGIVTSGGALSREDIRSVSEVLRAECAHRLPNLCASLGRLGTEELEELRAAGLVRYHHNLESCESYYPKLCTTQTWRDRLATVKRARSLGLEICCGGLFGTGESWDDRLKFALALAEEDIREIPLNFLHPHPGTPLADQPVLDADQALRVIAVFRHILPRATLRICGGRTLVFGPRQEEIFAAGANALMTGDYLTTSGRGVRDDLDMIVRLGLEIET